MAVRVVVAEDAFLVREAVTRLLSDAPDVELVAAVADTDTLMATIEAEAPDVVVTDIRMPPTETDEGIRVAARLRDTHPEIGVVVLSQYAEPAYVLDAARGRLGAARLPAQGACPPPRAAGRRASAPSPRAARTSTRRSSSCSWRRANARRLAARRADAARARGAGRDRAGQEQRGDRRVAVLTKRAVEKHINAIFMKLNLAEAPDVEPAASRRRCCSWPRAAIRCRRRGTSDAPLSPGCRRPRRRGTAARPGRAGSRPRTPAAPAS